MSGLNNNEFRLHQFSVEVCDIIRQIPAGKVLTYGQIAVWRDFQIIPVGWVKSCHTIRAQRPYLVIGWSTAKDGQLLTGPDQKSLLAAEGITFQPNGRVDLKRHLWLSIPS